MVKYMSGISVYEATGTLHPQRKACQGESQEEGTRDPRRSLLGFELRLISLVQHVLQRSVQFSFHPIPRIPGVNAAIDDPLPVEYQSDGWITDAVFPKESLAPVV